MTTTKLLTACYTAPERISPSPPPPPSSQVTSQLQQQQQSCSPFNALEVARMLAARSPPPPPPSMSSSNGGYFNTAAFTNHHHHHHPQQQQHCPISMVTDRSPPPPNYTPPPMPPPPSSNSSSNSSSTTAANSNQLTSFLASTSASPTPISFDAPNFQPNNNNSSGGHANHLQHQKSFHHFFQHEDRGEDHQDSDLEDQLGALPPGGKPVNYCKLLFKIAIVLISFAGFLYQATDICAHYFSYRTVVYTNTEQDSLVDLPSITFCLPTYFTKKSLEELYEPYIKRNVDESAGFRNATMQEAIRPIIYETFQKQAFRDLTAAEILDRSISDDGIIECRLFYPPQHWPNLTRQRMYEIVQYGLPCEEVTQVIPSINANGKCFTFFSQLLTDGESLRAYQQQQSAEPAVESYQQYPQMTSFATSSASSASTRSSGPVAPPIVHAHHHHQHSASSAAAAAHHHRYVPVLHKISVNHGYRFHSGRFMRLQVQFNRDQYTVISDGHQRECIQVHPPFKIPSEACIHSINPGMAYDFVLTKTKAILQPPPYQTNCQSYQAVTAAEGELLAAISDPAELKEFYLKPMSRSDCIDKCMIHIYEKTCGCLPIHISIWQRSSMFLNMSVCDYDDYERISPCLEKELSSTCYDTCKSDCIDRHYHLHAESRVYPSDEQLRQATGVEKLRLQKLRSSAATISIWSNYLSDITYVHTPAMSLIQLICYLGGLAGLWLGVSVMTVSGWLAQLYPFLQKWNIKQRFILLSAKRNLKYAWDGARNLADRRRNNGGYRQQAKTKSSKVLAVSGKKVQTMLQTSGGNCSSLPGRDVIVTTASDSAVNGSVLEMGIGSPISTSNYHRRPPHLKRHCSPSRLVKQGSVNSTTTDIDSGLSMESKTSSASSYLEEMMLHGCSQASEQEPDRNRDQDEDLDEEEEEENDQTSMMMSESALKSGASNDDSSGGSGNVNGGFLGLEPQIQGGGKRRRHSMMAQMIGVASLAGLHHHGSGGNGNGKCCFEKASSTPFTSSAAPPLPAAQSTTGSSLPQSQLANNNGNSAGSTGSPGHQGHLNNNNNHHQAFSANFSPSSSSTPSETLKQQLRWKARRSAYWSNYSSMSTSSDDLSLISNATSSTMTGGGGSVTGIATATSTAFRRMSLVNSKFSCKV